MAATCDICGKGPSFGNNVSHSQVKTRRRWNPNIQRVRTLIGGTPMHQNVCTSCLRLEKLLANFIEELIEMAPGIWRFFHL